MTLVLRLIMNSGFSFDSANRVFRVLPGFMGKSLVIAVISLTKRNNKNSLMYMSEANLHMAFT